jgi:methylated-DNA-protein-cysteine methyltransferase-like protein
MTESFFLQVYAIVRCIPAGKVATYGQIAQILGSPRSARTVGWALRGLPDGHDVPWQRVISARGCVSFRPGSPAAQIQRGMLEDEGIVFDDHGRVDLRIYGWVGLDPIERDRVLAGIQESS